MPNAARYNHCSPAGHTPVGDVTERHERRRLSFPLDADEPQLGDAHRPAAADDFDLGVLAGGERVAEFDADQVACASTKELFGGGIGETNAARLADDDHAVRQPLNNLPEDRCRRRGAAVVLPALAPGRHLVALWQVARHLAVVHQPAA